MESGIRREIQALVQYVLPGVVVIVLRKGALAKLRGKQRPAGNAV